METDRLLQATYRAEREHFWFRGLARFTAPLVAKALSGVERPRILDCGCGTGANMRRLAALRPQAQVFGFDLSRDGLRLARSYDQRRVARASATDVPFASAAFDLVTAFDLLACFDEAGQRRVLGEMRRVLRPGGALLVNTAALRSLRGQHAVFGGEVRRLRRRELRQLLEGSGFRVQRLTYTNFSVLPLVVSVRVAQRLLGLGDADRAGADIQVPAKPVNAVLSAALAAEAAALRVVDMPLGSSLLALAWRAE